MLGGMGGRLVVHTTFLPGVFPDLGVVASFTGTNYFSGTVRDL